MPPEEKRAFGFTGPTNTQGELWRMLNSEALKRGLDPKIPKYVSGLFTKSQIVPSSKHPAEIMEAVAKMLRRGKVKEHEMWGKIHTIVGRVLSSDRSYWNAAKVWPNNVKTERRAFPKVNGE